VTWFKLYCGWWMGWLVELSPEARLCWVLLIEHVKEKGTKGDALAMAPKIAAARWLVSEQAVTELLEAAVASQAVTVTNGRWIVNKWEEYQSDPTATKRKQEERERKKGQNTDSQVQNTAGHDESRPVTKSHAREERRGEERRLEENRGKENRNQVVTSTRLGEKAKSESPEDAQLREIAERNRRRVTESEPTAIGALASSLPIPPVGGDFVLNSSPGGTGAEAKHGA